MQTSRSFPCNPASVRPARHFVLQAVGDIPARLRDAVAVMTGELTMNAIEHARTGFTITVTLSGGIIRVEVTDGDQNHPVPRPMPPPSSPRGRGLPILDHLADDWGITPAPHSRGKSIWFTIAMPSPAAQDTTSP